MKKDKNNARFYVMALEDFIKGSIYEGNIDYEGRYYFYKNAYDKPSIYERNTSTDFGTGYTNTGEMIKIWNKNGIGEGSLEGAIQDDYDMWKHIQQKYQDGWYVLSRGEWSAFADYMSTRENDKITFGNYGRGKNYKTVYNLSDSYWTSSQEQPTHTSWCIAFDFGRLGICGLGGGNFVRIGTTF